MRLLIVGAGASYAEAENAGMPEELRPPLMRNFAARLWLDYNPHFLLSAFLRESGQESSDDARRRFIALESVETPKINVERFFEFAYQNRNIVIPGCEQFDPATEYENLLLHGIFNPLVFLLIEGLFKNGVETAPLSLTRKVASCLQPDDVVLNLNYDTILRLAPSRLVMNWHFCRTYLRVLVW